MTTWGQSLVRGSDSTSGGPGNDHLGLASKKGQHLDLDLRSGRLKARHGSGRSTLRGFTRVSIDGGDWRIFGTPRRDRVGPAGHGVKRIRFLGRGGDDVFTGGRGNDLFNGGRGSDRIAGGGGGRNVCISVERGRLNHCAVQR